MPINIATKLKDESPKYDATSRYGASAWLNESLFQPKPPKGIIDRNTSHINNTGRTNHTRETRPRLNDINPSGT